MSIQECVRVWKTVYGFEGVYKCEYDCVYECECVYEGMYQCEYVFMCMSLRVRVCV